MSYDDLGLSGRERRRPGAHEVEHELDEPDDAGRYDDLEAEAEPCYYCGARGGAHVAGGHEALEAAEAAELAHELSMFDDDDLEPELEPDDGG